MESKGKEQPIAAVLLGRAHEPDEAKRILSEKIQQRQLFLTPTSPPPSDARAARRREREKKREQRKKKLKPKPLSSSQRRKLGIYNVPRESRKYAFYAPLHNLWLGYIREVLGSEIHTYNEGAAAKLASADFTGAEVEVVRSGCVSRVGIKGIVIKDTKFAFEVITQKNALKLIPKEGTIFRIKVPVAPAAPPAPLLSTEGSEKEETEKKEDEEKEAQPTPVMVFEVHGEQFQYRAADRAARKFRSHFSKIL